MGFEDRIRTQLSQDSLVPRVVNKPEANLPDCIHRSLRDDNKVLCGHHKMHAPDGLVDAEICSGCSLREDVPAERAVGSDLQPLQPARNVKDWAVGMITAPRAKSTLSRSLESLEQAGWDRLRLFAEPGVEIVSGPCAIQVSQRDERLGAFPNWYLGLSELVMRHPHVDAFLMCEDDVIFSEGLRDYLERNLWPAAEVGVVSAYCPSHFGHGKPRGFHPENRGWDTWGALAYVFPNASARALISDRLVVNHRHHGPHGGIQDVDCVVGRWCERSALPYFVHVPSLAEHIGQTSTIFPRAVNRGWRASNNFLAKIDF